MLWLEIHFRVIDCISVTFLWPFLSADFCIIYWGKQNKNLFVISYIKRLNSLMGSLFPLVAVFVEEYLGSLLPVVTLPMVVILIGSNLVYVGLFHCFTKHLHLFIRYVFWKSNRRQSESTEQRGLRQGPEASSQFHEGILSKSESHLLYLWDAQMSVSWFLSLEHLFTWATCCTPCPWFTGWPLSVRRAKCGDFSVWLCRPSQVGAPLLKWGPWVLCLETKEARSVRAALQCRLKKAFIASFLAVVPKYHE